MTKVQETETFREAWDVDEDGTMTSQPVEIMHGGGYVIDGDRLTDADWILHMMEKSWVRMDTFIPAYFYALKQRGVQTVTIDTYY